MPAALNSGSVGVVMVLWVALVYVDKCKKKKCFFWCYVHVWVVADWVLNYFMKTKMIPFVRWAVNLGASGSREEKIRVGR